MIETDDYSFSRPYITPGEAILWKGKPGKGHLLTGQDVFMIPFSIIWCGFAFFWEGTVLTTDAPFVFKLFGLPFVCVGLYMVFGRFIHTAFMRKRTAYVITNKKIIRLRGSQIDMLDGKTMPPMHTSAYRDGSGTIGFGEEYYHYGSVNRKTRRNPHYFSLENIPDVARVQQYIDMMER